LVSAVYEVAGLRVRLGGFEALRGVTLEFREREMTAVLGPNGAGKSTLLSVLSGFRTQYEGTCRLLGQEVPRWNRQAMARRVAFIPQNVGMAFPFTAEEVVAMGRAPHGRGLFETVRDQEVVERAMALTDVQQFCGRDYRALSGGEQQRVLLAGALAQEPAVLLLDEPTTYLDLKHQLQTYGLLRDLARQGLTVVAVTHDLNLAAGYADRIVLLSRGGVAADAAPEQVLRPELLREVFEVETEVREGPAGRPWVVYGC
jgi:iron complex transport system ATP-binding protein